MPLGLNSTTSIKRFGLVDRNTNELLILNGRSDFDTKKKCANALLSHIRKSVDYIWVMDMWNIYNRYITADFEMEPFIVWFSKDIDKRINKHGKIIYLSSSKCKNEHYLNEVQQHYHIERYGILNSNGEIKGFDSVKEILQFVLEEFFEIKEINYVGINTSTKV